MTAYLRTYWTNATLNVVQLIHYRVNFFLWLIGMVIEPVIYLVVWTTVAAARGGVLQGYTVGQFAAYYIAWTLVRQMNIALTPWAFEDRVQRGRLSGELLRPIHPFHLDLSAFFGMKVVTTVLWLPIAVVLTLIFKPTFTAEAWQIVAFAVALVTGFVMRFLLVWALGLITFWVTRISAIFDFYFALELLLSGRLVPLDLLPPWAQRLADWLPFQWSFGFPLELIVGKLDARQTLLGFGAQLVWALVGFILVRILWHFGVRRYSAVGA